MGHSGTGSKFSITIDLQIFKTFFVNSFENSFENYFENYILHLEMNVGNLY